MAVNGKAKGSAGERTICKILTKWATGQEKPYAFWRTSNSGGTATVNQMHEEMSGDIMGINPIGKKLTDKFSVEIKTGYPKASLDGFFKNNKSDDYKAFWMQCLHDATMAQKRPLFIFNKKGNFPVVIGFNEETYIKLCEIQKLNSRPGLKHLPAISLKWPLEKGVALPTLILINFAEFLSVVSYEELCQV